MPRDTPQDLAKYDEIVVVAGSEYVKVVERVFTRYPNDTAVVTYLEKQNEVLIKNGHMKEADVVEKVMKKFYLAEMPF